MVTIPLRLVAIQPPLAGFDYFCGVAELNQTDEFRAMPKLAKALTAIGIRKEFKAGSRVVQEDAYTGSIPLVLRGSLRVLRTEPDGREILLYYIKAGESCVVTVMSGYDSTAPKVRAEVEDDAEILFLPINRMAAIGREHPEWIEYLFRIYHRRFEELLDIINAIAFRNMDERLWALLNKKAELQHARILYVTHEQIANELGTARVVVSRLLKQLETEGRLVLARNKIRLLKGEK